ncbi:hypothetical protein P153DRAFT_370146 [Dothidotthia symphoricarpi CBS 119687]|uniref:CCHC-type domain-containing protein n=1 Tax=Dothidotthia symphoricarpi CBS 119687 TaxID=1392245 RepID=A0A6A6A0Z4_9PLEO|nr:uncharacterized protein P153DRAFT_370146 [Dothidotthia symphoricarpi CBS 119687]KAF2125490.1 hypothetical protein P153DRAFT_370146 [Dothidotthia symphoricarpi CBS 119687]
MPNGPPSKKARLSHNGASAPGTPDHEILQSALVAEEKKRQEALDKAAQYTGETKWVLSFKDPLEGKRQEAMQVRQAGFAEIDAEDSSEEEEEEEVRPVRKQYGGGVKKKEKPVAFETAEGSEGETESSSGEYDSDDPAAELIRETKREVNAQRREAKARASLGDGSPRGPPRQLDEDMDLGGLTTLSGGRRPGGGNSSQVECFKCGQKGHMRDNCPKGGAPRGSAGRGRGRGRR